MGVVGFMHVVLMTTGVDSCGGLGLVGVMLATVVVAVAYLVW